jgi:hypothetical protein
MARSQGWADPAVRLRGDEQEASRDDRNQTRVRPQCDPRVPALESASGMLLFAAGVLAVVAANSPLAGAYAAFLDVPFAVRLGSF